MRTRIAALAVTLVGALGARPAAAGELSVEECISASENAQELRRDRKLVEAAKRFRDCSVTSCPALVRDDCRRQRDETIRVTPQLRVTVSDQLGRLETWSLELDGRPIAREGGPVDPGAHTVRAESKGYLSRSKAFRVEEGAIDSEEIVLDPKGPTPPDGQSDASGPTTIVGVTLASAGALGLIAGSTFGLVARSDYEAALAQCGPGGRGACSPAGIARREDAADKATLATWSFGAGMALLAAGAVVLFVLPRLPRSRPSASIVPAGVSW